MAYSPWYDDHSPDTPEALAFWFRFFLSPMSFWVGWSLRPAISVTRASLQWTKFRRERSSVGRCRVGGLVTENSMLEGFWLLSIIRGVRKDTLNLGCRSHDGDNGVLSRGISDGQKRGGEGWAELEAAGPKDADRPRRFK